MTITMGEILYNLASPPIVLMGLGRIREYAQVGPAVVDGDIHKADMILEAGFGKRLSCQSSGTAKLSKSFGSENATKGV